MATPRPVVFPRKGHPPTQHAALYNVMSPQMGQFLFGQLQRDSLVEDSQTCRQQDRFTLLKITEALKGLVYVWVIFINSDSNLKRLKKDLPRTPFCNEKHGKSTSFMTRTTPSKTESNALSKEGVLQFCKSFLGPSHEKAAGCPCLLLTRCVACGNRHCRLRKAQEMRAKRHSVSW